MQRDADEELVRKGKALALAIKGLLAIEAVTEGFGIIENKVRPQLTQLYRRELRRILLEVSREDANEVLAIIGPELGSITRDPSIN